MSATVASRADSLVRIDTLLTTAGVEAFARGAVLDATIRDFVVTSPGGTVLAATAAPVRVLVRFDEFGGAGFEGAGIRDCASLASAAAELTRDLWERPPPRLGVGDTWRDSSTVTLCRDGIPLVMTAVRDFELVTGDRPDSAATLGIIRRARVFVAGAGTLRGEPVEIRAAGTGAAQLTWSNATGWLLSVTGESELRLEATGRERVQVVEQRVTFRGWRVASADSTAR